MDFVMWHIETVRARGGPGLEVRFEPASAGWKLMFFSSSSNLEFVVALEDCWPLGYLKNFV